MCVTGSEFLEFQFENAQKTYFRRCITSFELDSQLTVVEQNESLEKGV